MIDFQFSFFFRVMTVLPETYIRPILIFYHDVYNNNNMVSNCIQKPLFY